MDAKPKARIKSAETAAEAAALWWRADIERPQFDNGEGEDSPASRLAHQTPRGYPEEDLVEFARLLEEEINAWVGRADSCELSQGLTLGVDYRPEGLLLECAVRAGLATHLSSFSWKTFMKVMPDSVIVRHGYSSGPETIWEKPVVGCSDCRHLL